jgi:hypothetical protein
LRGDVKRNADADLEGLIAKKAAVLDVHLSRRD